MLNWGAAGGCGMGSMITRPVSVVGSALPPVGRLREHRLFDGLLEPENGGGAAAAIVGEARVVKTAVALGPNGTHRCRLDRRPELPLRAGGQLPDRSESDRCRPGDENPAGQGQDLESCRVRPRLGRAQRLRRLGPLRGSTRRAGDRRRPLGDDRRCARWRRRRACRSATTTSSALRP
jgi:hypothetical protein